MKKQLTHLFSVFVAFAFIIIASATGEKDTKKLTQEDLVGTTHQLDTYHIIKFESSSRYHIYQKPLNCGGYGSWSVQNEKVILGSNDSNCESTQEKEGSYPFSKFE